MATLKSSIQLQDKMSATINRISQSMMMMVNVCESVQAVTDQGINASTWDLVRREVAQATVGVSQYREELERAATAGPQAPVPPSMPPPVPVPQAEWASDSAVFKYQQEIRNINRQMEQLKGIQYAITQQANESGILSPQASYEIQEAENRLHGLFDMARQVESNPLDIDADSMNSQLERLRGQLGQVIQLQGNLSQSMQGMSVESINQAYLGLSEAVENTERTIRDSLQRPIEIPVNVPPPPEWLSAANNPIFANTGAERFTAELQEADRMAQQLYKAQRAITAQAQDMDIVPPGMLNDMAATSNRVQMLSQQVQQLNNLPMELRTDKTNNELELLRGKLAQALSVQGQLNTATRQMDISAANAAYQRLNELMDTVERNLRDNFREQERFNQSMREGQSAADGLKGKVMGIAAAYLSAQGAQKVMSLSDTVAQTTARLELIVDDGGSVDVLQQKLFNSAQRSRSDYQAVSQSVSKLGLLAGKAFTGNDEMIGFVELMNKNFKIGGASIQEQTSAMYQLTQAMAAGKLQGDEYRSVIENAPLLANAIERYMQGAGVEGTMKDWAADGLLTAEVIKAALFSIADETDARFAQMPVTFGEAFTTIKGNLLQDFTPLLQAIGKGAVFIAENWDAIAPIFYGVAAAALVAALAFGVWSVATWILNGGLTALLANPIVWKIAAIAIVVGVVVAAIYKWVQSVGGLRVAWLICVDKVLTMADKLKMGMFTMAMHLANAVADMSYAFNTFKANVLNTLGILKVAGLTIVQDFINGVIDRINALIGMVNGVAGTSFELIGHVEFAAGAAIEEAAAQKQRAEDLAAQKSANEANKAGYQRIISEMQRDVDRARMQRQADIAAARADAAKKAAESDSVYAGGAGQPEKIAANTGDTAANTAAMADSMDAIDEDLKYMRDAAEQEVINRFTLAELKVDMNNNNTLTKKADFDDFGRAMAAFTGEFLAVAAEGGYA